MSSVDPKAITAEKRIWDIYKKTFSIQGSRFNQIVTLAVFIMLTAHVVVSSHVGSLVSEIRNWAELGLGYSSTMLGFILAGFTIFATLTRVDLFIDMLKVKHPLSGFNYLKHYFFVLMKVFIVFLALALLCLAVVLLGSPRGVLSSLLLLSPVNPVVVKEVIVKATMVLLGTLFIYATLLLKSFIFNIYQAVMMGVRYEVEKREGSI